MAVLNLQEDGKIQMLYNKWWKSSATCQKDEKGDSKANALGVENVGGIFVVLLGGLTLSIFIALFEFIWNSKSNATQDKVNVSITKSPKLIYFLGQYKDHIFLLNIDY